MRFSFASSALRVVKKFTEMGKPIFSAVVFAEQRRGETAGGIQVQPGGAGVAMVVRTVAAVGQANLSVEEVSIRIFRESGIRDRAFGK